MTPRRARRASLQWPAVLLLWLGWCTFWGSVSPLVVASGLVLAVAVLWLFPLPPVVLDGRVRPVALGILAVRFVLDLVRASVHVAWLALRPRPVPPSAVVTVRLRSSNDVHVALTAALVTLVPGSVVIEIGRSGVLVVHVLDVPDVEALHRARAGILAQEARVLAALEARGAPNVPVADGDPRRPRPEVSA